MKKLGIIIALLVVLAFAACVNTVPPPSGSNLNPTPSTYGLNFSGIDDQVNVGTLGSYGSMYATKGTIEFWCNIENTVGLASQAVIASSEENLTNCWGVWIATQSALNVNFVPYFSIFDNDGVELGGYAGGTAIDDGKWHHVAVTWDCANNTIQIYVDGENRTVAYEAQDTPSNFRNFTQDVIIGGDIWGENLRGTLGEVRVWSTIRTEQEINDNMDKMLTGNEAGLFAYWKFDEGSGTIAQDSSPNGNDGTLVGSPVWYTGGD
jgi:hypothetical protein